MRRAVDRRLQVLGLACGLAATCVFVGSLAYAAANDPAFVPFSSYLSDLGVGPEGRVFDAAVVVAGALAIPFALLGLWPALHRSVSAALAAAFLCSTGAFAVLAGRFTEDAMDVHGPASIAVFASMEASAVATWYALHIDDALGRWVTELTQAVAAMGIVLVVLSASPLFETILMLVAFSWLPVVAAQRMRLLLRARPSGARGRDIAPAPGGPGKNAK
jgi:hypothetical membrane protein